MSGPSDGAGVIHRAVEAEGAAAEVRRREVREHRVAWCAANALAETIDEAQAEDLGPRVHERDSGRTAPESP